MARKRTSVGTRTNITPAHRKAFQALGKNQAGNIALFSCWVNGEPTSAIVTINRDGANFAITPIFVAVTANMLLTDHEGGAI